MGYLTHGVPGAKRPVRKPIKGGPFLKYLRGIKAGKKN